MIFFNRLLIVNVLARQYADMTHYKGCIIDEIAPKMLQKSYKTHKKPKNVKIEHCHQKNL